MKHTTDAPQRPGTSGWIRWALVAAAAFTTVAYLESRYTATQRTRIESKKAELASLSAESARLASDHVRLRRELAAATADLAKIEDAEAPRIERNQKELAAWLSRVARMRQSLQANPQQCIGEMQFLVDADWLQVARTHTLDSDGSLRAALGALRTLAKTTAAEKIMAALSAYSKAHEGKELESATALAPYLPPGVEPLFLERYEMTPTTLSGMSIRERQPIDPDYDSRASIGLRARGMMPPPLAWITNDDTEVMRAYGAYAEKNGGSRPTIEQVFPYLEPKLDSERQKRVLEAARVLGR